MKILYLIRHAKSSWDNPDLPDIDRPLNPRGQMDAPRMGKRLKERAVFPDFMISSPAVRALETCKAIARILKFPEKNIKADKRLYHASTDQLLAVIRETKDLRDHEEVLMIFGHNPGLTDFVSEFLSQNMKLSTCAVVAIRLQVNSWKEVSPGKGKLLFYDFPKSKKA